MKYTVVWQPRAEARLAELWIDATDRAEVTRAADQIDRRLAVDPDRQSDQRVGLLHFLVVEPLGVLFVIRPDDRIVEVMRVWRYRSSE
jgi:hypothetical protein